MPGKATQGKASFASQLEEIQFLVAEKAWQLIASHLAHILVKQEANKTGSKDII